MFDEERYLGLNADCFKGKLEIDTAVRVDIGYLMSKLAWLSNEERRDSVVTSLDVKLSRAELELLCLTLIRVS